MIIVIVKRTVAMSLKQMPAKMAFSIAHSKKGTFLNFDFFDLDLYLHGVLCFWVDIERDEVVTFRYQVVE